jgi:hypothetical protein
MFRDSADIMAYGLVKKDRGGDEEQQSSFEKEVLGR